ncbi:MAG: hypothetical protein DMC59_07310 [Verrucomicrobia bacterium]|nr:MAG: hypothetical protein DMC59_07310 [Verrucomicrobiota bacterium]
MNLFFANFIDDRSNISTPKPKEPDPMKTDTQLVFLQIVSVALAQLKQRLQQDYEQAYPDLREIIHLVLDEEEANAWELSSFPHLLLPELVEAHITNLNLQPAEAKHADLIAPRDFNPVQTYQPAVALCG